MKIRNQIMIKSTKVLHLIKRFCSLLECSKMKQTFSTEIDELNNKGLCWSVFSEFFLLSAYSVLIKMIYRTNQLIYLQ